MKNYPYIGDYVHFTAEVQKCLNAVSPILMTELSPDMVAFDAEMHSGITIDNIRGKTILLLIRTDENMMDSYVTLQVPGSIEGYSVNDITREFEVGMQAIWGTFSHMYEDVDGKLTFNISSGQFLIGALRLP